MLGASANGWDFGIAALTLLGVIVNAAILNANRRALRTRNGDSIGAVVDRTHDLVKQAGADGPAGPDVRA